jgi:hypothetical protein
MQLVSDAYRLLVQTLRHHSPAWRLLLAAEEAKRKAYEAQRRADAAK